MSVVRKGKEVSGWEHHEMPWYRAAKTMKAPGNEVGFHDLIVLLLNKFWTAYLLNAEGCNDERLWRRTRLYILQKKANMRFNLGSL